MSKNFIWKYNKHFAKWQKTKAGYKKINQLIKENTMSSFTRIFWKCKRAARNIAQHSNKN